MNATTMQTTLKQWGSCKIIRSVTGDYRNAAFLIEWQGDLFVAKTTRRSESALRWLTQVHTAATQAGFLVPKLIPSQHGQLKVAGVTVETFLEETHTHG